MTNYEIRKNKQFNSLEVYFTGKPEEATRNNLKALKFRWNGKKLCWYGFAELDEVKKACEGGTVEPVAPKATKKQPDDQERLKAVFAEEIDKIWDSEDMRKFCKKQAAYIIELSNGDIIEIEKPRIETRFCFGYGLYGRSTQEEEEDAARMARHAEQSREYFINENLKGIDQMIEELKDTRKYCYTFLNYTGQDENSKLKSFRLASLCYGPEYEPAMWANLKQLNKIDQADRERIIKGYEIVKEQFIKRLNTYLKRYGLSKVESWTYLVD